MIIIYQILYRIGELYVVYLAIMGTWRLAQSTKERGTFANVSENQKDEEKYTPIRDLNPLGILTILKWFFNYKNEPKGVADLVIVKKQFNWGLRFIIIAIAFQFVLSIISIYIF